MFYVDTRPLLFLSLRCSAYLESVSKDDLLSSGLRCLFSSFSRKFLTLLYLCSTFYLCFLVNSPIMKLFLEEDSYSLSFQFLMTEVEWSILSWYFFLFFCTTSSHLVRSASTLLLLSLRLYFLFVSALSCLLSRYYLVLLTELTCFSSTLFCDAMKRSYLSWWYCRRLIWCDSFFWNR